MSRSFCNRVPDRLSRLYSNSVSIAMQQPRLVEFVLARLSKALCLESIEISFEPQQQNKQYQIGSRQLLQLEDDYP